jgi:SAM-dependent methyltransferase
MPDSTITFDSALFWDTHYAQGGTSGTGSSGRLAQFKADVVNRLIVRYGIRCAVELGCGDGRQAALIRYPSYLGFDTSPAAIEMCRERFADDPTKAFRTYRSGDAIRDRADLALSLDVIYHLLEDSVYEQYMLDLFAVATRYVAIYSSDSTADSEWPEVRHRRFTKWVANHESGWKLIRHIPNRYPYVYGDPDSSWADFYIYGRRRWSLLG